MLVSVAAGVSLETYRNLSESLSLVRALPNPPSQVGAGSIAVVFDKNVIEEQQADVMNLFESLGDVVIVPEEQMNIAMSLSGPAPIVMFFEALIDAGVRMGMDRKTSKQIAAQTIIGVMEVWKKRQVEPHVLLNEACTPGGISVEQAFTLDSGGFRALIGEAIENGVRKADGFGS
ncbi:MAG: hypothetical protein GY845_01710 [Planctomycetes bacterium]|nr:hypothetical protein [Planctomycetota bacterium]